MRPHDRGSFIMTLTLEQFQNAFSQSLISPNDKTPAEIQNIIQQPGFLVYKNTVIKGCIDTLAANYPTILKLTGEEWFRAAAFIYVQQNLPAEPSLIQYGDSFIQFLQEFPPAQELPYLPNVAYVDQLWRKAHIAPNRAILNANTLSSLPPEALANTILQIHPSVHWAWFAEQPIYSIWNNNRYQDNQNTPELIWQSEGVLLIRPNDTVISQPISLGGITFLNACQEGQTLAQASEEALLIEPDLILSELLAHLLTQGVFCQDNAC
jgi:hypothetical protein